MLSYQAPHKSESHSTSPWTDSYQESPLHRDGTYNEYDQSTDTHPSEDPAQFPTWNALLAIYDGDFADSTDADDENTF